MSDIHKNIRRIAELNPQLEAQCWEIDRWYYIASPIWDINATYRLVNKETGEMVMESHSVSDQKAIKANTSTATPQSDLTPADLLDGCIKAAITLLMKPDRSIAEVRKAKAWLMLGIDHVPDAQGRGEKSGNPSLGAGGGQQIK